MCVGVDNLILILSTVIIATLYCVYYYLTSPFSSNSKGKVNRQCVQRAWMWSKWSVTDPPSALILAKRRFQAIVRSQTYAPQMPCLHRRDKGVCPFPPFGPFKIPFGWQYACFGIIQLQVNIPVASQFRRMQHLAKCNRLQYAIVYRNDTGRPWHRPCQCASLRGILSSANAMPVSGPVCRGLRYGRRHCTVISTVSQFHVIGR